MRLDDFRNKLEAYEEHYNRKPVLAFMPYKEMAELFMEAYEISSEDEFEIIRKVRKPGTSYEVDVVQILTERQLFDPCDYFIKLFMGPRP